MATYAEQIQSAFNKGASSGKTTQQIYDTLKPKLASNPQAMNTLDTHFSSLNSMPSTQSSVIAPTQDLSASKPSNTPTMDVGSNIQTATGGSYDSQIKSAFDKYIAEGKSPQQVYDAMKTKLAGNTKAMPALMNYFNQYGVKPASPKMNASTDTAFQNTALGSVSGSGLDKDTQTKMNSQINVINNEFDDKIKTQQAHAKNILDAYNQNKDFFDAKYKSMHDTVDKMEQELNSNYSQLKNAVADNYKSGMETYARNAAAAQAGVTETLSKSGISGAALSNAIAEAQYDPKRLAAIQSLKDKQITDLTQLQTNYNNWANSILSNRSTLTSAEKALADRLLERKDQLDTELNNLKNTNLTEAYKPMKDIIEKQTSDLANVGGVNAVREKTLSDYLKATPARKKDILLYQLQQDSKLDTGFMDEALLNEALSKASLPDAITFLTNKIKAKMPASGTGGTSGTNPSSNPANNPSMKQTGSQTGTLPAGVTKQQLIDRARASIESGKATPAQVREGMVKSGVPADIIRSINFEGMAPKTNVTPNNKKNVPSVASEIAAGARAGFEGVTAETAKSLLSKIGNKAIPDTLKPAVTKLFAKAMNSVGDAITQAKLEKLGERVLQESTSAIDMLTRGEKIIMDEAAQAMKKPGILASEKALLSKLAQYGSKAIPGILKAGSLGAKVIGGIPFGVAVGVASSQGEAGGTQFSKRDEYISNLVRNGVSQDEANRMADKEASYGSFNS